MVNEILSKAGRVEVLYILLTLSKVITHPTLVDTSHMI